MGGDAGPSVGVQAALNVSSGEGVEVVLVGDRETILGELRRLDEDPAAVEIVHAGAVVGMDEAPASALRRKDDASVQVAVKLVKEGQADAVVTAGHSGAAFVAAIIHLQRLPGISRPALMVTLPAVGGEVALLDVGANVGCGAVDLAGFGVLGHAVTVARGGAAEPRVGLICNGSEACKGTEVLRQADGILSGLDLGYVGFVEGHEMFGDRVDVAVCDGFVGNVLLKSVEGGIERTLQLVREGLRAHSVDGDIGARVIGGVERRVSWSGQGGALLVGVRGVAVVAHGRSTVGAMSQAIRTASACAEGGFVDQMAEVVGRSAGRLGPSQQFPV